jgi:hypothetical protein
MTIPGATAHEQELIGSIKDPITLLLGQGPFDLQLIADREHFDFLHRLAQRKWTMGMDPLGKGFQMGTHPVDGPVRPTFWSRPP